MGRYNYSDLPDWEELAVEERGSQEMSERGSLKWSSMGLYPGRELKCSCSDVTTRRDTI
jgi:hypothetical protein